jgi:hypothetical protein
LRTLIKGLHILGYLAWGIVFVVGMHSLSGYFGTDLGRQINKLGLAFQFIGVLSVIIELIGPKRLLKATDIFKDYFAQVIEAMHNPEMLTWVDSPKPYAMAYSIKFALFGFLHLGIFSIMNAFQLDLPIFFFLFGIPLFLVYVWIWSLIINLSLHLMGIKPPKLLDDLFSYGDYCFSRVAVMIVLTIVLPMMDIFGWISNLTVRQMIAMLTFPFFFLGTFLQLIAAFL